MTINEVLREENIGNSYKIVNNPEKTFVVLPIGRYEDSLLLGVRLVSLKDNMKIEDLYHLYYILKVDFEEVDNC